MRLLIERVGRSEVERAIRGMLVLCREARACVEEPRGLGVPVHVAATSGWIPKAPWSGWIE